MTMSESDWEQESDFARYVLREPTYDQLVDAEDERRKRAKEEPTDSQEARG